MYVADRDELALYTNKGYVGALDAAAKAESPDAVLIAATSMGKDVAPRFAARHDVSVLADVMDLRVEGDRLVGSRPVYSGKARARGRLRRREAPDRDDAAERLPGRRPPTARRSRGSKRSSSATIAPRAQVVRIETSESKELDVSEADIIVSGGRGIKGPENWPIVRDLQQALGAALGASRAVVDAGWIDHQHQVGQTGKVVSPDPLRRLRHLRRHPAPGGHGDLQGHRRDQQGRRGADLQGRDLRRSSATSSRSFPSSRRRSGRRRRSKPSLRVASGFCALAPASG